MAEYKKRDKVKNMASVFSDSAKPYADAESGESFDEKIEEMELKNRRKEAFYVYPFGNMR